MLAAAAFVKELGDFLHWGGAESLSTGRLEVGGGKPSKKPLLRSQQQRLVHELFCQAACFPCMVTHGFQTCCLC